MTRENPCINYMKTTKKSRDKIQGLPPLLIAEKCMDSGQSSLPRRSGIHNNEKNSPTSWLEYSIVPVI